MRAMFSWIGFRQIGVPFVREERFAGEPKYSLRMSAKLAIDGLINFSTAPLRFVLTSGFVIAMMSFLVGLFAFAARLLQRGEVASALCSRPAAESGVAPLGRAGADGDP